MNGNGKKKIVIIGPAYPYRGGNSLYVTSVYHQLKNDFDVTIYNYKLLYPSILFPGTTQFDNSTIAINPVPNQRVVNSINLFNWFKVASLLKKEKADLVVFDWWHPFFTFCHYTISKLISSTYKNKILFITENVVSHESKWFEKSLTKLGLSNADYFLALSNVVEQDLKKYFPSGKIFRSELPVYDCYDMNQQLNETEIRNELGIKPGEQVLLFFGYIRKYKGLNVLIAALPEILKSLPQAKLLIVGEFYDDEDIYRKQVAESGLIDKVIFVNRFVPNEEVEKFYVVSDLVIMPYLSATQSGVLNVAYGFEKPVVVTDVGGLTESVEEGKTGIIIQPDDIHSLSEGVLKFFKLRDTVNFKENIRKKVKENEFSKLQEVFNEIIQLTKQEGSLTLKK